MIKKLIVLEVYEYGYGATESYLAIERDEFDNFIPLITHNMFKGLDILGENQMFVSNMIDMYLSTPVSRNNGVYFVEKTYYKGV